MPWESRRSSRVWREPEKEREHPHLERVDVLVQPSFGPIFFSFMWSRRRGGSPPPQSYESFHANLLAGGGLGNCVFRLMLFGRRKKNSLELYLLTLVPDPAAWDGWQSPSAFSEPRKTTLRRRGKRWRERDEREWGRRDKSIAAFFFSVPFPYIFRWHGNTGTGSVGLPVSMRTLSNSASRNPRFILFEKKKKTLRLHIKMLMTCCWCAERTWPEMQSNQTKHLVRYTKTNRSTHITTKIGQRIYIYSVIPVLDSFSLARNYSIV